ncbi:radical activating enzyme [Actinoplanes sp. ATCC 53533]|uniref:4Fe-4S single cluster domain-containing protein n=1 Tax=Actinoplanes sp. ATCC 53533 TaxID=1288362 RepID=UPI000F7955B6|nr:4Fe-4S single cluster domain-containing protein [Actinoplanes sp. ATCC 53533]RSM64116.1 radical activating enzyme [Actinoplanes sp. ATCC 53533]
MTGRTLVIAATHPACTVLGPGNRFAVWVQGCPLNCPGCVSPQWIPARGGRPVAVAELARRIADEAVDGLTLSGGEPFAQAAAVRRLVELVRVRRDLSVLSYTGFTLRHLREHGTADQRGLLAELDILIDGPYQAHRHADLRWRGSANQRIHCLTARHGDLGDGTEPGAGLQFEVTAAGALQWLGVPPVPGFRECLEQALGMPAGARGRAGAG